MTVTVEAAAPMPVDGGDLRDWDMLEQPAAHDESPTHCGTHWQGPSNCQRQCVLVHMGNRDPLSEHYNWRLDWNQAYSYGNDIENYDRSCPRLSIKRLPK